MKTTHFRSFLVYLVFGFTLFSVFHFRNVTHVQEVAPDILYRHSGKTGSSALGYWMGQATPCEYYVHKRTWQRYEYFGIEQVFSIERPLLVMGHNNLTRRDFRRRGRKRPLVIVDSVRSLLPIIVSDVKQRKHFRDCNVTKILRIEARNFMRRAIIYRNPPYGLEDLDNYIDYIFHAEPPCLSQKAMASKLFKLPSFVYQPIELNVRKEKNISCG